MNKEALIEVVVKEELKQAKQYIKDIEPKYVTKRKIDEALKNVMKIIHENRDKALKESPELVQLEKDIKKAIE
jgi:hypothetical protein